MQTTLKFRQVLNNGSFEAKSIYEATALLASDVFICRMSGSERMNDLRMQLKQGVALYPLRRI